MSYSTPACLWGRADSSTTVSDGLLCARMCCHGLKLKLMASPRIARLPSNYRLVAPGVYGMYVRSLGLSLVNLTNVFCSLGQLWRRELHPKTFTPVFEVQIGVITFLHHRQEER